MIVPMKKVTLLIKGDKKEETLQRLRKLGLMQVEITEGSGERLGELKEQISLLENAVFSIGKAKSVEEKTTDVSEALNVAREIASLADRKKEYGAERIALSAELDRLKQWGEIDPKEIEALAAKGVKIQLYEMPKAEYEALGEGVTTVKLEAGKSSVKFMLICSGSEEEEELTGALSIYRLELPKKSTEDMKARIAELSDRIKDVDDKIASCGCYIGSMKEAIKFCEKEMEFEVYATGMADEALSADDKNGVTISYFHGFIEAEHVDRLKEMAKANCWGISVEEPSEEDNVPTKLKNNKFVSLIYPLTDFLGTVPGYFEYDISAWFLLFILIFFGIIFGDGGYGLLISAVALIAIAKARMSKKPVPPAFLLVGLFGVSTILWGTLTCTWFGLSPEQLPQWLKALSIPVISNVYADKLWSLPWTSEGVGLTTAQNLQIFCFSLALIQLTIAHIKGALRNRSSLKMLGDIGSILQLAGIYYVVLSLVVNAEVFSFGLVVGGIPVGTVAIVLIAVGFVLGFVFSNYDGSVLKSVLESCTNIVSVLLGVVNVFSDIVSYIRLWAVGLAGAAISATVNELAGPLLGNFMFMILAIVLLVFGHGLNMILNVLSVIVHGIRLNTLEFSSHLDMSWSGRKFKPFEE
ncbi:MAG: ATPase [Firmicutes bacterium]|nr:ATPase [Bacillota bacterium]